MTDYSTTKSRVLQWLGIILIIGVFAGAYWYWEVRASTLNQSKNDLVTNGLVGLWSFNGDDVSGTTAYDRSGQGNNGTLTNGPAKTEGKIGQALNFWPNGADANAYITMGDPGSGALDFGSGDFSVGFWMKGNGYVAQASSSNSPVSKHNYDGGSQTAGYSFSYSSPNLMNFIIGNNTTAYAAAQTVSTVADNQWHHYIGERSGNTIYLYVDGSLVASTAVSGSVTNGESFLVGANGTVADRNINGSVDEVRVYNRALSAAEIQAQYATGQSDEVNTGASQAQGTGRLDSGLAGYWKLDDGSGTSATDSSTNGNTGTLTNGPTWGTGQIGGAVTFDGTNDYIALPNTFGDFGTTGDFTVSSWFRNTNASADIDIIFSKDAGAGDWINFGLNASHQVGLRCVTGGGDIYNEFSTTTYNDSTWHHLVAIRSASGTAVTIYVDGVAVKTSTGLTACTFSKNSYTNMGTYQAGAAHLFKGDIDEFRVYNRALSADEVAQLYRLNAPTGTDTSLKGYWSFNGKDVSGTTAYDRSGAGNTGTLTNGPTSAEGRLGQGLSFDGTNDWVSVAGLASVFDTIHDQAGTVTAWFKSNSWGSRYETIFSIAANSNNRIDIRHQVSTGNTFQFLYKSGGGVSQVDVPIAQVPTGEWHFVVLSWSAAAGEVKAYLDGVQAGTTQGGPATKNWSFTDPASIGRDYYEEVNGGAGGLTYFAGKIDETRVYSRALSAGEIKGLYDAGGGSKTNSSVSQAQGTGRLDSGLAGYWKLDDGSGTSATDSSTNGNTGTLTNGPTWTTGRVGSAVNFDGTDDYISAGQMYTTGPLTASVWVYTPTYYSAVNQVWLSNRTGGNQGFSLGKGSCTTVGVNVCDIIFTIQGVAAYTASATVPPLTSGQWDHVVVTYTGSELNFYVNGRSLGTQAAGSMTTGSTLYIGTQGPAVAGTYQVGKIDEARIYNRVLSADEVAQLYRLGTPTGTDTSLKGYWSFNGKDVSGTTAYDRSGAGNNGTLTNGPTITEGKVGQALDFDGGNSTGADHVAISDNNSLDMTTNWSVGVWVNFDTFYTDTCLYNILVSKDTDASNGYYGLGVGDTGGCGAATGIKLADFKARFSDGTISTATGVSHLQTGTWYYMLGTYDGAALKIYVNGVLEGSTAIVKTPANSSGALIIGKMNGASSFNYGVDGKIDEVRIYNRALSASEVAALYNSSR